MAAEDEGRTEEASEYRIEKERKEGRVAKSSEVSAAMVLLLGVITLVFLGGWILSECIDIYKYYFNLSSEPELNGQYLYGFFVEKLARIVLPVTLVGIVAGFIGNVVQTRGVVFSFKPITPDFKKIIPNFGKYFKRTLFSLTGIFNLLKSIGKVALIGFVAYIYIKDDIFVLLEIIKNGQILNAIGTIASMCAKLLITVAIIFLVISIPDFFVQKKEFMESLKMTKQEVKEEYKEMEGDPEVKGRLKQMQQQLLSQNIPKAVSESDVVITNPTHFAVSLKYDDKENAAPVVTAKGQDEVALLMRRIARENDVPIEENKSLARSLYTDLEVGDIIPDTYFIAISQIYAHIYNSKVK